MPGHPLDFNPAYTISDWSDVPAAPGTDECEIAKGAFHGIPVTYYLDTRANLVRAAPADLAAAGQRLSGVRSVCYRLYAFFHLDGRSSAMKALWRFSATDSQELCALGIAGLRALRARNRLQAACARAPQAEVAGHGQSVAHAPAVHGAAPQAEPAAFPPAVAAPAAADKPCPTRTVATPSRPDARPTPVARTSSARTSATCLISLDAIGVYCLRLILTFLGPADRNAMALVCRHAYQAASEDLRWDALHKRAANAATRDDIFGVLRALGIDPASAPPALLPGERTREARVLAALIAQALPVCRSAADGAVRPALFQAVMAIPQPARYDALLAWLQTLVKPGIGAHADAEAATVYAALPPQCKAQFCIGLARLFPEHRPAWLGLDTSQGTPAWLDIARGISPTMVVALTTAVVKFATMGDGAYGPWPVLSSAVRNVLNAAAALDDARRAAVVTGLMEYGRCILREQKLSDDSHGTPAGLAEGSLWRTMLDAIPARHALVPLHQLAWHFRAGFRDEDIAANEARSLMDRVTSEAPDAMSPLQKQEILLILYRGLSEAALQSCRSAALCACEDAGTPAADMSTMAFLLADTLDRSTDEHTLGRMLAICASPRLSPADQAELLARLIRAVCTSALPLDSAFRHAIDLAEHNGQLMALRVALPYMPEGHEPRVRQVLEGCPDEGKTDILVDLVHSSHSTESWVRVVFSMLSLDARLAFIGIGFTPLPLFSDLLESVRHHRQRERYASKAFWKVLDALARRYPGRDETIDHYQAVLAGLRTAVAGHPPLSQDENAWTRTFLIFDHLERQVRLYRIAGDTTVLAQQRNIAWHSLRIVAPALEAPVRDAIKQSMI